MTAVPVEITTQPTTTDIELVDDLDELVESSKCSRAVTTDDASIDVKIVWGVSSRWVS